MGMVGAVRLRGKVWGEGLGWEVWFRDFVRCFELGSWFLFSFFRGYWVGVRGFGCFEDMWEGEIAGFGLVFVYSSFF